VHPTRYYDGQVVALATAGHDGCRDLYRGPARDIHRSGNRFRSGFGGCRAREGHRTSSSARPTHPAETAAAGYIHDFHRGALKLIRLDERGASRLRTLRRAELGLTFSDAARAARHRGDACLSAGLAVAGPQAAHHALRA